ncbi:superoxide dismutase [Candidatus Saccharibacteria bacterium]|nr:MAG: superoxide dismutase [Candidatus Saccharibacteria bacterium]
MHSLPTLPYDYDALSRSISADIMKLHHQKHHQSYVDKLNQALEPYPDLVAKPLEDVLADLSGVPDDIRIAVRNHGGGHYNHSLFWNMLAPNGGGQPRADVMALLERRWGSYQEFVDKFTTESLSVFGSGWCWLLKSGEIITTQNQDSPLMLDKGEPLLGLDVWEHAYYLDYMNDRSEYIRAWWDVVNWEYVDQRLGELG